MCNYQKELYEYQQQKQIDKQSYTEARLKHASAFFNVSIDEKLLKLYESVSLDDIIFVLRYENMRIDEFCELLLPHEYRQSIFNLEQLDDYHVSGIKMPRKKPVMYNFDLRFGKTDAASPTQGQINSTFIPPSNRKHFGELILPYHDPTVKCAKTDHRVLNKDVADYGHFSADLYEKMRNTANYSRQITRQYLYPVCMYFHMSTAEVIGIFERCRNIEPLDINHPTYGLIDKVFVAFLDANCYDYDEFVKVAISQFNKYNKTMPTALFKSPFWQKIRDELLSENGYSK